MANKPKNQENNVSSRKNIRRKRRALVRKCVNESVLDESSFDYVAYAIGCGEDCFPWRGAASYLTVNVEDGEISEIHSKFLRNVTSNYLHMLAIMSAVNSVPEGSSVVVYTQSIYAMNILSGNWKARKHQNLISNYQKIANRRVVELEWKPYYLTDEFKEMRRNIESMPEMNGVKIKVRHKHETIN